MCLSETESGSGNGTPRNHIIVGSGDNRGQWSFLGRVWDFYNGHIDMRGVQHVAIVYEHNKGKFTCYIDGVTLHYYNVTLNEEFYPYFQLGSFMNCNYVGTLYEFRVTLGQALWTEEFSPPQTLKEVI